MTAIALGVLSCSGLCGCGASLRHLSAGYVGCAPDEIAIVSEQAHMMYVAGGTRTWTAVCRGERFQCSEQMGGESQVISCTPEVASAPRTPTVRRVAATAADGSPIQTIRAEMDVDGFSLAFVAAPARDPSTIRFVASRRGPPPPSCGIGFVVDQQLEIVEGAEAFRDGASSGFRAVVPMTTLRAMAAAARVAGRVCEREWRLGDAEREALRELVARIDEDLLWASRHSTPAGASIVPFAPAQPPAPVEAPPSTQEPATPPP